MIKKAVLCLLVSLLCLNIFGVNNVKAEEVDETQLNNENNIQEVQEGYYPTDDYTLDQGSLDVTDEPSVDGNCTSQQKVDTFITLGGTLFL